MELTDWKGNIINSGDTIVLVRTKPMFGAGFMLLPTGEYVQITEEPPEHIWQVIAEHKVTGAYPNLITQTEEQGFKFTTTLKNFLMLADGVICIKGLSDNEQDYYTEYFK